MQPFKTGARARQFTVFIAIFTLLTSSGSARFSPLVISGTVIPTLYAGTTLDCALMETVFHDVPYVAGPKMLSKAKHVTGRSHSSPPFPVDLPLIALSSIPLRTPLI